jgi:hypothetical protein
MYQVTYTDGNVLRKMSSPSFADARAFFLSMEYRPGIRPRLWWIKGETCNLLA